MNERAKAYFDEVQIHLKVLEHYRDLGQELTPLVDAKELVPGAKASLREYLDLIIREIALLKHILALVEKHPDFPVNKHKPSPQAQRKFTQSQVLLYEKYKSLGMTEDEAINRSLDTRSVMFKKFEDLAVIYNYKVSESRLAVAMTVAKEEDLDVIAAVDRGESLEGIGNAAGEESRPRIKEATRELATTFGHQMLKDLSKKQQEINEELGKWRVLLKRHYLDKGRLVEAHGEALFETYLNIMADRIDVLERQKAELPDAMDTLLDCKDGKTMMAVVDWMDRERKARAETSRRLKEFRKAVESK